MRVAIVGSRFRPDQRARYERVVGDYLSAYVDHGFDTIVSGGCPDSPDELAEVWADDHGALKDIYPVDGEAITEYGSFGKAAFGRNVDIVNNCDRLVAFWNGKSKGTKHSIDLALAAKKNVEVIFP